MCGSGAAGDNGDKVICTWVTGEAMATDKILSSVESKKMPQERTTGNINT